MVKSTCRDPDAASFALSSSSTSASSSSSSTSSSTDGTRDNEPAEGAAGRVYEEAGTVAVIQQYEVAAPVKFLTFGHAVIGAQYVSEEHRGESRCE